MVMQHKPANILGDVRHGLNDRLVTVTPPAPYEGVGKALRSTFRPVLGALPDDMLALLSRMDKF